MTEYLAEYGLEVLIAFSRFWRQRVNWSDVKGKYVILGVTGPNEYENNVNNNWYTNKMAAWTLRYTLESLDYVMREHPLQYQLIVKKTGFRYESETSAWHDIIKNMYFPVLEERGIFLQQDDLWIRNNEWQRSFHLRKDQSTSTGHGTAFSGRFLLNRLMFCRGFSVLKKSILPTPYGAILIFMNPALYMNPHSPPASTPFWPTVSER